MENEKYGQIREDKILKKGFFDKKNKPLNRHRFLTGKPMIILYGIVIIFASAICYEQFNNPVKTPPALPPLTYKKIRAKHKPIMEIQKNFKGLKKQNPFYFIKNKPSVVQRSSEKLNDLFNLPVKVKRTVKVSESLGGHSFMGAPGSITGPIASNNIFNGRRMPDIESIGAKIRVIAVSGSFALVKIGSAKYFAGKGNEIEGWKLLKILPGGVEASYHGKITFERVRQ